MGRGIRALAASVVIFGCSVGPFGSAAAQTVIHHRYANFTLDGTRIVAVGSGSQASAEYRSGSSDRFLPVRPNNLDRLIVHIKFVDSTVGSNNSGYRRQYLVLRDLGRGLFNQQGWQSFRSTLSLDSGGATATYNPGWTFPVANPSQYSLWASPTRTVSNAANADASLVFNLTDNTIAIHELTVEYNFNNPYAPLEITEGAGFDRISLVIQADDIAIAEMPQVGLNYGPRSATGGGLDFDGDGSADRGTISTAARVSQHFKFGVTAWRGKEIDASQFAYFDALGPGFELDPAGEQSDDGCVDGVCDGIASQANPAAGISCSAVLAAPAIAGPAKRATPPGAFLLQVDQLPDEYCAWSIYAKIAPKTASGLCESVSTPSGQVIVNQVALDKGARLFDKAGAGLLESLPPIQLRPIGCL